MKALCLDLSTKTGWSLLESKTQLVAFGLIKNKVDGDNSNQIYPQNFINAAKKITEEIDKLIVKYNPDIIIIEETNSGRNRFSQKTLEFIHYAFNDSNKNKIPVKYLDSSEWRNILGLSLSKDDRKLNKEIKGKRDDVFNQILNQLKSDYQVDLNARLAKAVNKREQNKVRKIFEKELIKKAKDKMRSYRVKDSHNKVVGKVDFKALSVELVNNHFNLSFKKKDNDIADSICLGLAFFSK